MVLTRQDTGAPTATVTWRPLLTGAAVGIILAIVWSYEFVDDLIGQNLAGGLLGQNAATMHLTGVGAVLSFALATGIAGSFTACNVAAFSALAPVTASCTGTPHRLAAAALSMGWVVVGATAIAAPYGAVAAAVGSNMPQLSMGTIGAGLPLRLVHASVVFGALGLLMTYLALVVGGRVSAPRPFAVMSTRTRLLGIGALIGAFLVGRPYPLFRKLFEDAAQRHDPLMGALSFALQSLGNVVVLGIIAGAVVFAGGDKLQRWLTTNPRSATAVTAGSFAAAGLFLFLYWAVRVPAMFGYGWFPQMPWNT